MKKQLKVGRGVSKARADKWISDQLADVTRVAVQRSIEAELVKVNGQVLNRKTRLSTGDVVDFEQPEVVPLEITGRDIPLNILFEDKDIIVINKASGMIVHPGAGTRDNTLVHALLHHCEGELSGIGGVERPGIVHRLDKETSGVMVVAKNDVAHQALSAAFADRTMKKKYLALVAGVPDRLSASIKKPIGRNQKHRHKMTIREDGRFAHTDWEFLGSTDKRFSLLLCEIHTGRTHQIRVHLAEIKHAILGDAVYGYRETNDPLPVLPERIMLHAWQLELAHPVSKEQMSFTADLPADFIAIEPTLEKMLR